MQPENEAGKKEDAQKQAATPITGQEQEIVGRGVREGARLYREWFGELTELANSGGRAAYVFVMGSMIEILRTFDIPVSFPEVNALNTAIRRVSGKYLREAEDYGYSPDICGYVKADVALQLGGGEHPMGRVPKPSLAVMNNACNTYIKWGEIWERMYDIPAVTFDLPSTRAVGTRSMPGSEQFAYEREYVLGQVQELIATCERMTGKKFDLDKFREILVYANTMSAAMKGVLDTNKNSPAPFNALTDGTVFLGVANAFRGTKAGADYFTRLLEEMQYRVEHGIGALERTDDGLKPTEQRFRLALLGTPCYPIFRNFNAMFSKWGGMFVASSYMWFASGGAGSGYQYDLTDPLAGFAEGVLCMARDAMDGMFYQANSADGIDSEIKSMAPEFRIDGLVYHPVKSCRTVSTGLADQRQFVIDHYAIPSLMIESDLMDPQVISEAQMKNRVDAFFEGLISRRQRTAS